MTQARVPAPLRHLSEPGAPDDPLLGGKARGLARLAASGLPVPPAVVVPSGCMREQLVRCGLADPSLPMATVAARLVQTRLDPVLAGALRAVGSSLGDRLAVRSSAAGEDGAEASHAGQYATLLGVRPGDDLEQAVLACWASAFSAHAEAYRQARAGRARRVPPMAVVVQALISPRCAGVLFTINPATGSWTEMTVEAAWGLGESVVSGRVVPDFYTVRRPRRLPRPVQRLVARVRLEETGRQVHRQTSALVGHGSGVAQRDVPPERQDSPKLSTEDVLRLCRLGLRVEARSGVPQDIEWALDENGQFYVLQARPVTTAREVRPAGEVIWTRRFVGERWTEPATPLGWSLMGGLLDWFIAYPEVSRKYLGGAPASRLHRCSPYLNTTVFRHLAFKAPGASPPRFMLELLPPQEAEAWLRRHTQRPDLRIYGAILKTTLRERRWRRFRWNPVRNPAHWDAFVARLDPALVAMAGPPRSRSAALARVERCEGLARDYIKVHVCSLLYANIWFEAARSLLAAHVGVDAAQLLRPSAPTWTVRTAHGLWALARGDRSRADFLAEFGHRSSSSWALFAPRWREAPELLDSLLAGMAGREDPLQEVIQGVQQADRAQAGLPGGLRAVVGLTRRYLQLREDQRFHFDRLLDCWKQGWELLEAEEDLELRFLDKVEARALLQRELSRSAALARVARRRTEWEEEQSRWAAGDAPPTFLGAEERVRDAGAGRLSGQGISAGTARGMVRVVRHLGEARALKDGEILVARATDPGWTPLFLRAHGLVLELGGMLSHGAVVARELGLPAVVNVARATQVLKTGQMVTVDGSRGLVYVH